MATRTLEIDLRQGTGASSEPMYGIVTVQRVKAKSTGGFVVLPFETSLKLVDGKATITQAVTDGTGPMYDSAYLFRVQNGYCGQRYGFMAALPDGTTPITTGEMPMVNPLTGEGIYMDAQEWNTLYGDLPNRVSSLETGKANTSHTHAIGDVTGLQTALNAKGNATMRVDTSVGTRVFITNGTTERLVSADTGIRNILPLLSSGATATRATIRRIGDVVYLDVLGMKALANGSITTIPAAGFTGFRPDLQFSTFQPVGVGSAQSRLVIYGSTGATVFISGAQVADEYHLHLSWTVSQPWPTTLPGTPA